MGCALCGFVPHHPCQLDIDHRNGNPADHRRANLQVLCANCYRLKPHLHEEWRVPADRPGPPPAL
jgi:hypothetical protein